MSRWAVVLVSWTAVASATLYSVERSDNGIDFQVVASGTGLQFVDTLPTYDEVYYYRIRAYRPNEWSPYSNTRVAVAMRRGPSTFADYTRWCTWLNSDSALVCVVLPPAPWTCSVQNTGHIVCLCEYDYTRDGLVTLSDFAYFGLQYRTLPELIRFSSVYYDVGIYIVEVPTYGG